MRLFVDGTTVAVLGMLLFGCTSSNAANACAILLQAEQLDQRTATIAHDVLQRVALTGTVSDWCATEAAIDVTRRWAIQTNVPLLRRIATLDLTAPQGEAERVHLENSAAQALHALMILKDDQTQQLARRHLDSPASVAGTAMMTLHALNDWQSTEAVAARLARDDDPRRHYSLVWLGLAFLSESPQEPPAGCAMLRRLSAFDSVHESELRNPTIAMIVDARRNLSQRYGCQAATP